MNDLDGFDRFESLEDPMMEEGDVIYFDGFDEALIGIGTQFNRDLAVYDFDKCVRILMDRDGMSEEEAVEYMDYNVVGAYVGTTTPVFIHLDAVDLLQ